MFTEASPRNRPFANHALPREIQYDPAWSYPNTNEGWEKEGYPLNAFDAIDRMIGAGTFNIHSFLYGVRHSPTAYGHDSFVISYRKSNGIRIRMVMANGNVFEATRQEAVIYPNTEQTNYRDALLVLTPYRVRDQIVWQPTRQRIVTNKYPTNEQLCPVSMETWVSSMHDQMERFYESRQDTEVFAGFDVWCALSAKQLNRFPKLDATPAQEALFREMRELTNQIEINSSTQDQIEQLVDLCVRVNQTLPVGWKFNSIGAWLDDVVGNLESSSGNTEAIRILMKVAAKYGQPGQLT